ncbi:uncharacterized protein (TIGR03790 family) [Prosthecobacter fusiformis]|uniref:Uncharacterized protein (TIGR03790 family) n=1 Tax=Prosthecobacter fusiformis TaxID=48464 RepID=A0A4R7RYV7_9BACT|nr:TIGR03790 family protein [Prosthecobacter fusiformis]TDU71041.1 uncharacterized protein (TIGR03790 family) [Prosthecobacter fusiformis]
MTGTACVCWLLGCLLACAPLVNAQDPLPSPDLNGETVVVYNPDFSQSRELAEYYAEKRGIPQDHLISLACPINDSMTRQEYDNLLRKPLFEALVRRGLWRLGQQEIKDPTTGKTMPAMTVAESAVRVVVLMRGIPFQIQRDAQNPKNTQEDEASVDSELCLLGLPRQPIAGALRNPYYGQDMRFQMFQGTPGLLLVGRLDAPDSDTVKRMIDDAISAEQNGLRGRAVIDLAQKTGAYQEGEDWLTRSAILFRQKGIPVYVDKAEAVLPDHWPLPDTAFYFGWYTTNASGAIASPSFRFQTGAIACHLHSFSGAALRSPDRHWVGPLLRQGAAAALGNVFEPYLSLTVHFDILNQRLLEGYTLAEASWNATPVLSWMNVVCGDPLYRPYAKGPGSSMGEGRDRDYALYQGTALRHPGEDSRELKRTLTSLAETRSKPHMLELTGLLSASEGKNAEAIDLLEHALSLYVIASDKARAHLYQARLYLLENRPSEAKATLQKMIDDPDQKDLPAAQAARLIHSQIP